MVDLVACVNLCRTRREVAEALASESLLQIKTAALLGNVSRGELCVSQIGPSMREVRQRLRALFARRRGQLS